MISTHHLRGAPGGRTAFKPFARPAFWAWMIWWVYCFGLNLANAAGPVDSPPTETQVKAAMLFRIAKFVDWPAQSFATNSTPMVVGIAGGGSFYTEFEKTTNGKTIGGHPVEIRRVAKEQDLPGCHILFVGASAKKQQAEFMTKASQLPILTVGETEDFLTRGGIITFVLKDNKVNFRVNLEPARQAQLSISSRVLSLADSVSGMPERQAP